MDRPFPHLDAVFFDCDGVLLDSAVAKERAFRQLLAERLPGHLDAGMDYYQRHGGTSRLAKFRAIWRELAGLPLDEAGVAELAADFSRRVFRMVCECPWMPGAEAFVRAYCPALPAYVISGTPQEELDAIFDARGLRPWFRGVHGSPRGKAEIGAALLADGGYAAARVAFVGDATTDRDAAEALGLRFVGVHGAHLTPFLRGDERMIGTLAELPAALAAGA